MQISSEQVEDFYHRGYLVLPCLFTSAEVECVSGAFDRLLQCAAELDCTQDYCGAHFVFDGGRVHRVVWCGAAEPALLRLSEDARLVDPVARLLGSDQMEQLICQAHFKQPGDGVSFDWHQDAQHRRYGTSLWSDVNGRGSFVQTVLAVDPMQRDNGPLYIVPGSCQMGPLPASEVKQHFDPAEAVPLLLEPGSVAMFGPYTIHGSFPNESPRARRVFINGYACPGANRREYPGQGSGRKLRATAGIVPPE